MAKIKQSFLLLMLLMFAVGAFAQGKRVTVDFKSTEATAALRQIEKQSGLKMQYSIKDMKFRFTYSARNAEPVKVVKDIVGSHGFSVGVEGKYLTIYRASADPSQLSGRKRKVSGYVRDESGDELMGVPVCIGEGRVCTVTDDKGFYTFEIPVEQITLKYSYVGLGTEYVQIAQGNADVKRDVTLKSNNTLDEVLSISIDKDANAWKKALDQEKLPWPNILDNGEVADIYNVKAIPAMFLMDANGKLIATGEDARGQKLAAKLAELLK